MADYSNDKAIVIGAGIAGLASAIRLKTKGWEVEVYEKNRKPGGKVGEFETNGFRFDTGPSLFTLPELVDDLFYMAGKDPRDYFDYNLLEAGTTYFYEDGTILAPGPEKESLIQSITENTQEDADSIRDFLNKSEEKYEITKPVFLESSLHKRATYLKKSTLKRFLKLPRLEALKTMANANQKQFRDPKVQQLFNRYATFNGSNPYATPATFNVIPHLEHNLGAYWPKGGMYQLIEAIYQLGCDIGIDFYFEHSVERIIIENDNAKGIKLDDGNTINADTVISNMDVHATYRYLLPGEQWISRFLDQPRSTSALIFYWGLKGHYPELGLHNILFAKDYEAEFNGLFEERKIPDDPTTYIFISSKVHGEDAPEGYENWYVMVNAPWNNGQDWEAMIKEARENIQAKIARLIGYDVKNAITFEKIRDPKALENETSAFMGSLYGNSANNLLAAFLRHPNFSPNINGLYFCGGTVHPGGGIPLCLLSAKIATELVQVQNNKVAV